MFNKKLNIFLLGLLFGAIFFFLSTKTSLAEKESSVFYFSLNFQKILKDFLSKIFPNSEPEPYKEKYFKLLEELAKLKLTLKEVKETEIALEVEKYKERAVKVPVLKKDNIGYIYIQNFPTVKEGMIVVDENWILVGKVAKVYKNYSLIESLLIGDLKFNVANLEGELLGLGQTLSNGFLEIRFVDPKIKIKEDDFVLTYGDNTYPAGFLLGSVDKIVKTQIDQKIIVKLLANFNSENFIILK